MFVAGRLINIEGKDRDFGQPVPEAQTWPPHIRKAYLDTGALVDVDDKKAMELHEQYKQRSRDSEREFLERTEKEYTKKLEEAIVMAKKLEDSATAAWAVVENIKKEAKKSLLGSAPLQGSGNAEGTVNKAAPSKSKLKAVA